MQARRRLLNKLVILSYMRSDRFLPIAFFCLFYTIFLNHTLFVIVLKLDSDVYSFLSCTEILFLRY